MSRQQFHPIVPGEPVPGNWFNSRIPANIVAGEGSVVDSSFCFKHFYSERAPGLRLGSGVTIWRTNIAIEKAGYVEVGDRCYLANASIVCAESVRIGARVFIAGGVTIADSDFHPLDPAARMADTIALSLEGDHTRRPAIEASPVTIGDDVWIGFNAVVLKGVSIGSGATIAPGAVVTRDVPAGASVAGNPARSVEDGNGSS